MKKRQPGAVQRLHAIEDEWSKRATLEAIEAARAVIAGGSINSRAMLSGLSELEWGWIVCAAIAGWIKCKAQQAVQEGVGYDEVIRFMPVPEEPLPWDCGVVNSVLPSVAKLHVPWDQPMGEWDKEAVIYLFWQVFRLLQQATGARDKGAGDKITQFSQERQERELMAKNGGSLVSRKELEDDIPF